MTNWNTNYHEDEKYSAGHCTYCARPLGRMTDYGVCPACRRRKPTTSTPITKETMMCEKEKNQTEEEYQREQAEKLQDVVEVLREASAPDVVVTSPPYPSTLDELTQWINGSNSKGNPDSDEFIRFECFDGPLKAYFEMNLPDLRFRSHYVTWVVKAYGSSPGDVQNQLIQNLFKTFKWARGEASKFTSVSEPPLLIWRRRPSITIEHPHEAYQDFNCNGTWIPAQKRYVGKLSCRLAIPGVDLLDAPYVEPNRVL